MNNIKVYISHDWQFNRHKVFVRLEDGPNESYLTYDNGQCVAHVLNSYEIPPVNSDFLTLPDAVFKAIEEFIIRRVEERGGLETAQRLSGRVEQMEKEIEWLRKQLEK